MPCKNNLPTKCCCGCSLSTGGKIIVLLQIIISIILMGILFAGLAYAVNGGLQSHELSDFYIFFSIELIICICNILLCVLVLYGIARQQSRLIVPWLFVYAVLNIVAFIVSIVNLTVFTATSGVTIFSIIFLTLIFFLQIYFWSVMLALYYQIRGEIPTPYSAK